MKAKYLKLLPVLALAALLFTTSCRFNAVRGSGNMITETRNVGSFDRIEINNSYKVIIKQDTAGSSKLTINADDNLLKYIKTDVSGGKLHIFNKKNIHSREGLTITVTVKDIKEISASGTENVESDGKLTVKNLKFDISGITKLNMQLDAAEITTDISGMAKMTLTGQASVHRVQMSGMCKLDAFDLVVGDYDIESSGIGKCDINVLNRLDVHTSGASTINYKGNPKTINNNKSGAGSLKKVD
jgi:hypothetical protein